VDTSVDGKCVEEDIVLLRTNGSTDFDITPIAIVSQDTSQVTFDVTHQWKDKELSYLLYMQYGTKPTVFHRMSAYCMRMLKRHGLSGIPPSARSTAMWQSYLRKTRLP
jgi:hypothetical protein